MEIGLGILIILIIGIVIGFFFGCRYERRNNDKALQAIKDNFALELKNMRFELDAKPNGL